ncbi:MAG: oligosaccharide flippase family protein [Calditrichaceae bacterium]|nr:oligosaccharide flippase family protein [Calditrichaceae bacterium]RQV96169.1 MAG: hypothetical protein EH224_05555 [Calditrichota bacterium]
MILSITEQLKNLLRHSSIYTISTFLQRALGLVMLPVYTNLQYIPSKTDLADQALVYTFIAFMTIIFLYGLDSAVLRYFFLGEYKREDVYKTAFLSLIVNVIFLSGLIIYFSESLAVVILDNSSLSRYMELTALILVFDSLGNMPYLVLRAEERSVLYSAMRMTRFFLEFILNIIFVMVLRQGVIGILYATLLASILNFFMLLPFQWKYLKGKFSWPILKTLLAFGLPMLPNGIAFLVVEVSDKYVMRLIGTKEMLGTYAPNHKWGSLIMLIVMAFRTAWQPFFLKLAKETNAKEIYSRTLTYFVFGITLLILWGSFFIEYLVKIPVGSSATLMGREYWDGLKIIPLILTSYLFYGIYVNMTVGVYIMKKTKYMALITGAAALVNVGSNLYLIPAYGVMGASMAALLSYLAMAVLVFILNQKIYPIAYDYKRLGFLLIFLAAFLALYYSVDLSLLIRILLALFIPVMFLVGGFFDKIEIDRLKQIIKK